MKKIIILLLLTASFFAYAGKATVIKFDNLTGLLIHPDDKYLTRGIQDDEKGRKESARSNFLKSAEYGNHIAISMLGWYDLQAKNYIDARAWLQLVDVDKLPNKDTTVEMLTKLDAYLTAEEMEQVKAKSSKLAETYGDLPTFMKRVDWKKNIKVTGSRNKGKIPMSASFSLKGGIVVDGGSARSQVEDFVFDYKYSDLDGRAVLGDLELVNE